MVTSQIQSAPNVCKTEYVHFVKLRTQAKPKYQTQEISVYLHDEVIFTVFEGHIVKGHYFYYLHLP